MNVDRDTRRIAVYSNDITHLQYSAQPGQIRRANQQSTLYGQLLKIHSEKNKKSRSMAGFPILYRLNFS